MIRICIAAVAALALAACSKAPEDVTARYALAGGAGTITVQAAGNGDARVESGQQVLVRKGGTEYLLVTDSQGRFAAKMEDFIAAMGEMIREAGMKPTGLPPQSEYDLAKTGSETVAGIPGDVWKVSAKGAAKAGPAETVEAVISGDPAYANVGKALTMQTRLGTAGMQQVQGGAGNLEKKVAEMLDKGMVLRFGDAIKLEKVEKAPIEPSSFTLPAVLDKAALKTRMTAERERARAAAAKAMPGGAPSAPAPAPAPTAAPAPAPAPAPGR
nr:hypothetical protein [uncultured organism]